MSRMPNPTAQPREIVATDPVAAEARAACARGAIDAAVTACLTGYGPELAAFAVAIGGAEPGRAAIVHLAELLWGSLPGQPADVDLRVLCYRLTRLAVLAELRHGPGRRATATAADALAVLADNLAPADAALLFLRDRRAMGWPTIAAIMSDTEPGPGARDRKAAALIRRYEVLDLRLRAVRRLRPA